MLALDVVFFVIHARCNVAVLAVSNLTCSFRPPSLLPPCTLLYSVLLWACTSALQALLKSPSGTTWPNQFPLLPLGPFLFLLDLPLMFTTFILY